MKCPICNSKTGIEIDMHSDGYARDIMECTCCNALWMVTTDDIILLNKNVA